MQTNTKTILAEQLSIPEGYFEGSIDSSRMQSWQYYYSDFHQKPIVGVYPPRYLKWSFDGRYFSASIPVYREGAGAYIFDIVSKKHIPLQNEDLFLECGGQNIYWSNTNNKFVSASAQTGWSESQFLLVDMDSLSQYINLNEAISLDLEDSYSAIISPDNTKIAFLGIPKNQTTSLNPTLFELDISTNQVRIIYESEYQDSMTFPFFYSENGDLIYYMNKQVDDFVLNSYDRETRLTKVAAIFTNPMQDARVHLADSSWHDESLFLTFYFEKELVGNDVSQNQEFYTQIVSLNLSKETLVYQSSWIPGIASILRIEKKPN